jgi:tetraacyldisaccharide 4'-kinase
VAARFESIWYGHTPPPITLRVLSKLFGLLVQLRRSAYARGWLRTQHLARPVVVVGNLTVGGNGKTPLVIWLTMRLRETGYVPGIVLRGHGGAAARESEPHRVEPDSDPQVVGDEALLLRRRTGEAVAVCRERARAARLLIDAGVNVIVSDDGLQHLSMARNFEIVVVDGQRGFGNGELLPAGPLREPRTRLAQVDVVVINGEANPHRIVAPRDTLSMKLRAERLMPLKDGTPRTLSSLAGQRVHAVAGIGNPQRFFALLRGAGLTVIEHAFPDHHRYRAEELEFPDQLPLLMTEKDAVKCAAFGGENRWFLPVTAVIADADATTLLGRVRRALGG